MAADRIKELQEKRSELGTAIQTMVADTPADEWTDELEARFQQLNTDYENTKAELESEVRDVERAALAAKVREDEEKRSWSFTRSEVGQARMERKVGPKITNEMRYLCFQGFVNPKLIETRHREAAKLMGVNFAASEQTFMSLFRTQPKDLEEIRHLEKQELETRQQGTTPDSAGGYTVMPAEMMASLELALLQFGPVRSFCTVIRTSTGAPVLWPTINDTTVKGEIIAENTAHNQGDVTVDQVQTSPFTYSSKIVLVSEQLLQDSEYSWATELGRILGTRLGRKESEDVTVGAGTTEPRGYLLDAADSGITLGTANAPSSSEIYSLIHSVDPAYRNGAIFTFHDTVLGNIKQLATTDGYPIWKPGVAPSAPDTLDGYRYVVNQDMPTGSSAKSMSFGDHSKIRIHEARGIDIRRTSERYWEYLQVGFLGIMRMDSRLVDAGTNPVKFASNPA